MLNHARAAVATHADLQVDLIGMAGIPEIGVDHPRIRVVPIAANCGCLLKLGRRFWPLYALLRIFLVTAVLLWTVLFRIRRPEKIIMQVSPLSF